MGSARPLPSRRNPLAMEDQMPPLEELVKSRRLGQTEITVRPNKVATSDATRPEKLGVFDYVHLRVPLPKNLKGSEVFVTSRSMPMPEGYFLLRRCSDGFISATGMFKATFPWASIADEELEREYIRTLPAADNEEIAGNIWIAPHLALALATEYRIWHWIAALLDNANPDIDRKDSRKDISLPPDFKMPPKTASGATGAASPKKKNASRDLRSTSPVKKSVPAPASPNRPKAAARKPRAKKEKKPKGLKDSDDHTPTPPVPDSGDESYEEGEEEEEDVVVETAGPKAAAKALADAVASTDPEPLAEDTVRVSITSDTTPGQDNTETTRTTVKVELPSDSPDLKLPKDTEGVVAVARDVVESAKELQQAGSHKRTASTSSKAGKKRKAEAIEDGGSTANGLEEIIQEVAEGEAAELATANGEVQMRPAKRTRVMVAAEEYRREKVKRRALMGLSGALAVGVMIPFLSNLL